MNLVDFIPGVPDYPKPGILFYDITPLLADPHALDESVSRLAASVEALDVTCVAGIESRGFIFGAAVARELGLGFVPIRKPGKLPRETISEEYSLEYGTDKIEMHRDALKKGDRVLLVDDLLATGGTMKAATSLVEKTGAEVARIAFVVELLFLDGRKKLDGYDVVSLVTFS